MEVIKVDLGKYEPREIVEGHGVFRYEKKLELKSDPGELRVGFWGCGSAFASYQGQSNMVVIKGDTVVFIDLGSKTTTKMSEFGVSVHDIDNIIVTHSHADHIGSLEELGLKRRYEAPFLYAIKEGLTPGTEEFFTRSGELKNSGELRTPMYIPKAYGRELWAQSLRGGMAYSEEVELGGLLGGMKLDHFFDIRDISEVPGLDRKAWRFEIGEGENKIDFLMYVTPHIPEKAESLEENFFSAGFLIDNRVVISGDTKFDPAIFYGVAKDAEVVFHDCQSFVGGVHAGYDELKNLDEKVKNKTYLYHCDDGMRPLVNGKATKRNIEADGFAGYTDPIPTFYAFKK